MIQIHINFPEIMKMRATGTYDVDSNLTIHSLKQLISPLIKTFKLQFPAFAQSQTLIYANDVLISSNAALKPFLTQNRQFQIGFCSLGNKGQQLAETIQKAYFLVFTTLPAESEERRTAIQAIEKAKQKGLLELL